MLVIVPSIHLYTFHEYTKPSCFLHSYLLTEVRDKIGMEEILHTVYLDIVAVHKFIWHLGGTENPPQIRSPCFSLEDVCCFKSIYRHMSGNVKEGGQHRVEFFHLGN